MKIHVISILTALKHLLKIFVTIPAEMCVCVCCRLGYDQIPIDMQGLEIDSHGGGNGSTYSAIDAMDVGSAGNFEIPTPPQENNQVAAWYDTDL